MSAIQNVSLTAPTDYSAEALSIERRRKLAEQLQAQNADPLQTNQMAGGYVVPVSPYAGLAKALNQGSAGFAMHKADEDQKALSKKYQDDLAGALTRAQAAGTGAPATSETIVDEQAAGGDGQTAQINAPARAPDRQAMIQALMSHPATQGMAFAQMTKDMDAQDRKRKLADALGMTGGGGAPAAGGTPGAPSGGAGGMMAGLPKEVVALMTSGDPELVKLGTTLMEANKGIAQRPGAPVVNPFTGAIIAQPTPNVPAGVNLTVGGAGGPVASPIAGYGGAMEAVNSTPNPSAAPVKLKTSSGQDIELSQPEYVNWQKTGQLPQRFGQQGAAPPQGAPAAAGSPPAFPRETPAQLASAGGRQLEVLQAEAKALTDAKQPIPPALAQEIRNAQTRASGQYPSSRNPPVSGLGTVGATQTQEDVIRQQRETAAGKAVDEQFAKDYVQFTTGGAQDTVKQLAQLDDVVKALGTKGVKLTGPFIGGTPDAVLKFNETGRNSIAMRERVEEVVQRSLRAVLGAQFTEKEGERLIARAYNPSLSEKENAIRVGRLYTQLQQAYEAKQSAAKYFEKNNTLEGWKGKLPSMSDFDPTTQAASGKIGKPQLSDATREFLKQQGISVD